MTNPPILCILILACATVSAQADEKERPISYNFEVRPILAEHCFKCHGQDEKQRKAKLRLDNPQSAIGASAIVPGDPEASSLIERVLSSDEEEVMPPPKEHRPLKPEQISLLRQWIAQGAPYERHWAFIPPVSPRVPDVNSGTGPAASPVDAFVIDRLAKEGLEPAKPAAREEWLRRVTFDLTGLPPTLAALDAFLQDTSPRAFETVVDRLLSSDAYGEHMAVPWLDVARYADTYGRHEDHDCITWPYRDWVVRAFNANLPYDKFVLWQTAGDMLPGATQDMRIATAFNRLPQQSNEAGSNEEEFRQDIVADRVRTNGIAFMGLSLECARCHDHKYDPVTMRDYYSLAALLNNIDECGLYTVYTDSVPAPSMFVYRDAAQEQQHLALKQAIAKKEAELTALRDGARGRFDTWIARPEAKPTPAKPMIRLEFDQIGEDKKVPNLANPAEPALVRLKSTLVDSPSGKGILFNRDNTVFIKKSDDWTRAQSFSVSFWINPSALADRAVVVHHSRAGLDAGSRGYEVLLEDGRASFALCHFWPGNAIRIRTRLPLALNKYTLVTATYDGSSRAAGMHLYINGLLTDTDVVRDNLYKDIVYSKVFTMKDAVDESMLALGGRKNDRFLDNAVVDDFRLYDRELSPVEVRAILGKNAREENGEWFAWWLREVDPQWKAATAELKSLREQENKLSMELVELMVMREMPEEKRRPTHVLARGNFEAPGELVSPDVPASVLPFPADLPRSRLGYARWLVDRRNPLTARVFVNRVWQQFFGRGIVPTSEDFGLQGQLPTHPELLDWLAVWFMDNGWDVKKLCRLIVLSGSYRQSSEPRFKDGALVDSENLLISRGPRVRLTAEELRDNALSVSGLLNPRLGGLPVKPYQPAGLWEDAGTQHSYDQSRGGDLFRRSLYTFWRRTLPPPSMTVFDSPTREFCRARREKSATPLQPLVLFNDPQFVEAARVLSERLVRDHPADDAARVQTAYRLLTSKSPDSRTTEVLARLIDDSRARFKASPQDAEDLRRKNGEAPVDGSLDAAEVAATTLMARALLGCDECVMKP